MSKNSQKVKTKLELPVERRGCLPHNRKPKPDDRSDNVEKLREQVVNTIENLEEAHDLMQQDLPEHQREALMEKNKRREEAIAGKREEIKDEWEFRHGRDNE